MELEALTLELKKMRDLSRDEADFAASSLADNTVADSNKREFLIALNSKGENANEVASFADTFRDLAINPGVERWASDAIDVCGTGGDGSGTFNISTAVSFILAAMGVPVFKHGNRSITSKCGSADLMEAFGFKLDASHELIRESLEKLNFCFFFAPAYHPAFRHIMPVRQALAKQGQRTVFNLLGPLINPGRPAHQLMGVFAQKWVVPIAEAFQSMGLKAGLVVHGKLGDSGDRGLDELSCSGVNHVAGFGRLQKVRDELHASSAGLSNCPITELNGGNVQENFGLMQTLLGGGSGVIPSGLIDSVLFNAGAGLWIVGKVDSITDGVESARIAIKSKQVWDWLQQARAFYKKV